MDSSDLYYVSLKYTQNIYPGIFELIRYLYIIIFSNVLISSVGILTGFYVYPFGQRNDSSRLRSLLIPWIFLFHKSLNIY